MGWSFDLNYRYKKSIIIACRLASAVFEYVCVVWSLGKGKSGATKNMKTTWKLKIFITFYRLEMQNFLLGAHSFL